MGLKFLPCVVAVLFCFSTVSCTVGRRMLKVPVPAGTHTAVKGQVALGTFADQRKFANKPSDPSSPSMNGDVTKASAAELSTLIGRQRGSFGTAVGDIGLPGGATVPGKMKEILTEALARRGYSTGGSSAHVVSGEIQKFWGWMTPGMWSIGLEVEIECLLTIRHAGSTRTVLVRGYGENYCQAAGNRNWNQTYELAVNDFLEKVDKELASSGF